MLGVFITSHFTDPVHDDYRHGRGFSSRNINRFAKLLDKYEKYDPGIPTTIYIMDTESTDPAFINLIEDYDVEHIVIPNQGGCFAGMKHVMHHSKELLNKYEYYFFHVDDTMYIKGDGWAKDLIDEYEYHNCHGVIGREKITLRLGPDGLVDHRHVCPHIAQIWGITEVTDVPHLHADWYFMDDVTLKNISIVWNDPIYSEDGMSYQLRYENDDYVKIAHLPDGRRTLDNFHIGREVDFAIRLEHIGLPVRSYKGNKVITSKEIS